MIAVGRLTPEPIETIIIGGRIVAEFEDDFGVTDAEMRCVGHVQALERFGNV